jgi:hypothetical protein
MADSREATNSRYVTSYGKRRAFAENPLNTAQFPPAVAGVADFVDIHSHAHKRQQDGLALAKHASASGMRALLLKTLPDHRDPMSALRTLEEQVKVWADAEHVKPVRLFAGFITEVYLGGIDPNNVRAQLERGVKGIWFPVASHANTVAQVGGRPFWWGATSSWSELVGPMPFDEAKQVAGYLIGAGSKLDPRVAQIVELAVAYDAMLSFGHMTRLEQQLVAEEVARQNMKKAVFDHPLSPFVDLSIPEMVDYARAGMWMNFTYDELSPLLGVDPAYMFECIKAIGTDRVTLSSDAGEPFFPNSVECMRLMSVYMGAFGLNGAELRQVLVDNPSYLLGIG